MVVIKSHHESEAYSIALEEAETIEITINGNSVFTQTIQAGNQGEVNFNIVESLADTP